MKLRICIISPTSIFNGDYTNIHQINKCYVISHYVLRIPIGTMELKRSSPWSWRWWKAQGNSRKSWKTTWRSTQRKTRRTRISWKLWNKGSSPIFLRRRRRWKGRSHSWTIPSNHSARAWDFSLALQWDRGNSLSKPWICPRAILSCLTNSRKKPFTSKGNAKDWWFRCWSSSKWQQSNGCPGLSYSWMDPSIPVSWKKRLEMKELSQNCALQRSIWFVVNVTQHRNCWSPPWQWSIPEPRWLFLQWKKMRIWKGQRRTSKGSTLSVNSSWLLTQARFSRIVMHSLMHWMPTRDFWTSMARTSFRATVADLQEQCHQPPRILLIQIVLPHLYKVYLSVMKQASPFFTWKLNHGNPKGTPPKPRSSKK